MQWFELAANVASIVVVPLTVFLAKLWAKTNENAKAILELNRKLERDTNRIEARVTGVEHNAEDMAGRLNKHDTAMTYITTMFDAHRTQVSETLKRFEQWFERVWAKLESISGKLPGDKR